MLQINSLAMDFAGNKLFSNLSLRIEYGSKTALVGSNGAGKSTLLKIIIGAIEPTHGCVNIKKGCTIGTLEQEESCIDEGSIFAVASKGLSKLKQIEQKINNFNVAMADGITLTPNEMEEYSNLTTYFENHGGFEMDSRVSRVLDGLGFKRNKWEDPVITLSGGWRRRLRLAVLLLEAPDILLLDEPTNHLDASSIDWLENYIRNVSGIVIMVSHDRYFIERICDSVVEISKTSSNYVKCGFQEYLKRKELREKQLLKAWNEQQEFIQKTQTFIDKFRYNAAKSKQVQSRVKSLEKIDKIEIEPRKGIMDLRFPEPPRSGISVIKAQGLSKSYDSTQVFNDIDFQIERGEKIALSGENGAGKTTLLKILSGNLDYEQGNIDFGHNVRKGYFAQHTLEQLDPEKSLLQVMQDASPIEFVPQLRSLLGCFLFNADDMDKKVAVLSGGEKARLSLAKLLMRPYNLLIIDEPTNHLDVESREVLSRALIHFEGTIIIVSHDRYFTDSLVNRVLHLENMNLYNHLGNLSSFISKRRECEENSTHDKDGEFFKQDGKNSYTKKGLGKTERAKKLKEEREQRIILKKQIMEYKNTEQEIFELEEAINKIKQKQSLPEIYSNPEKSADYARLLNEKENLLEEKMLIWEESAQFIDIS